jgi:hypothetical protein
MIEEGRQAGEAAARQARAEAMAEILRLEEAGRELAAKRGGDARTAAEA